MSVSQRRLTIRPGDVYVIENGFVCHINTFFSERYVPFAEHDGFETAFKACFTVIATKQLRNSIEVHSSPLALLLMRFSDGMLCSTYVWDDQRR